MAKAVTVRDLPYLEAGATRRPMLKCLKCGEEYSANRHDYFYRDYALPFRCCRRNLVLVNKRTVYAVYDPVEVVPCPQT